MSISELIIGSQALTSYYDASGVLLIARGVVITETLVEKLRRHGVETLHVGKPGERPGRGGEGGSGTAGRVRPKRPPATRKDDSSSSRAAAKSPPVGATGDTGGDAGAAATRDLPLTQQPALQCYSKEKIERISKLHAKSLATVERLVDGLIHGGVAEVQEADPVLDAYVKELSDDPDPVLAATLLYEDNLEIARRCVRFSTLSLAVGLRMTLSSSAIRELGRAALIHDWGLLELPSDRRYPQQPMSEEMRQEYQQHPLRTEAMMHSIRGSTFTLSVLVAQVHELLNGSGFPRRLSGDAIHPLARILSAVDTFLMLTQPPPGCSRIVPCDAMAFLLAGVSRGQYAPTAVSGLLEAVTMYPIGSLVDLSDSTRARVVRSNGKDYGYPIVEPISEPGTLLNLKESSVFITKPVLHPELNEARLPRSLTEIGGGLSDIGSNET